MVSSMIASHRVEGTPDAPAGPARLSEILLASIRALDAAGEVENACRLAGQACVALRRDDPAAARRFDALLHRLTRKLTW
jgi:hypothetical protein